MNIVNRFFTPEQFAEYVKSLDLAKANWRGQFVVLHNTSEPTLAQRPDGFNHQMMLNLADYYSSPPLSWSHGPHLFVDDNGIWVFSPLNAPGVHSPSWNQVSYGVEMLGDYSSEEFADSVRGQAVRSNAVAAVAVLSHFAGIDSSKMRLHKEDPKTTHKDCPGSNVSKSDVIERVHNYIVSNLAGA